MQCIAFDGFEEEDYMAKKPAMTLTTQLLSAAEEYFKRLNHDSDPAGSFDHAARWHPSPDEERSCCWHIRLPTRPWPNSLSNHCRSIEHIANLFDVNTSELRRVCLRLKKLGAPKHLDKALAHLKCVVESETIQHHVRTDGNDLDIVIHPVPERVVVRRI